MLPFVLVIRGDDPDQAQFGASLYERVQKMLREGTTAQSLQILDVAHPTIAHAQGLSAFADARVPPPFIVSLHPTRRIIRGEELNQFTRVIIDNTEPRPMPAPVPPAYHQQQYQHQQPSSPPPPHPPPHQQHHPPPPPPPQPDDGTVGAVAIDPTKFRMAAQSDMPGPGERDQPAAVPAPAMPVAADPPPGITMSNPPGGTHSGRRPPPRENSSPDPTGYKPSRQVAPPPEDL